MKKEKHNYFEIHATIKVKEEMTTKEFDEMLHKAGFEVLGNIGMSLTCDADYE